MGEERNGGEKELISRGSKTVFHRVKDVVIVVVAVVIVVVVVVVVVVRESRDGRTKREKKINAMVRKKVAKHTYCHMKKI